VSEVLRLVSDELDAYAREHTTPPAPHLVALAEETRERLPKSHMLTGPIEGRLLETLVFLARPRLVVDVGTYSGHSALSMAAALPPGGRIVSCEVDPEIAAFARRHIEASPYADRIDVRVGPAVETIASLVEPVDLAFVDADRPSLVDYYEALMAQLSDHGVIVVDNTLWRGRVVAPEGDRDAELIAAFNDHVAGDERSVCVLLPLRDGMTLIRRAKSRS
jgi:predicted O-methyltransferase YrrM